MSEETKCTEPSSNEPEPTQQIEDEESNVEQTAEVIKNNTESSLAEVTNQSDEPVATEPSDVDGFAGFEPDENDDDNNEEVNVILKPTSKGGIYKTGATYQARSIAPSSQHAKTTKQGIELDDPGDIQGVPTLEFSLSNLGEEDKPWKRPGADITDYFNYGFTEETWIQYCEKQKILRQEYANATLKPVLSGGGAGLLHRLRTGSSGLSTRQLDGFKQMNMNIINLSNNAANSRGLLNQKSDPTSVLINGISGATPGLLGSFAQPPPGYPAVSATADGTGGFTSPTSGFAAAQLLAGSNAAAPGGMFPNLSVPPPMFNWPGAVGVPGLLPGDAMIDPATGQLTTAFERSTRSPESVYSTDDHNSRRRSRHYRREGDDGSYFDRDSHRSRRRSRSDSRDRYYSRHHRRRESGGRSERDYDSRSSRRSRRSRDRFTRDDRYSDNMTETEDYPAPTSAIIHSRSSRDRSRDDPSRGGGQRSSKRERDRPSRSSRSSRYRSRSRSPRRHEGPSSSRGRSGDRSPGKSKDNPLLAAAAAAANIALAIGEEATEAS